MATAGRSTWRPPTREGMVESLAGALAGVGPPSDDDRGRAERLLEELGVADLLDTLAVAERILMFGQSFHSVERFFVDGSAEQRYLLDLLARS